MKKLFHVDISTPDKKIYDGKISSLIAPGEMGYLGVLANHAPFMTTLAPGKISFNQDSEKQTLIYSKGKGFLEVLKNDVTILLDDVEYPT